MDLITLVMGVVLATALMVVHLRLYRRTTRLHDRNLSWDSRWHERIMDEGKRDGRT